MTDPLLCYFTKQSRCKDLNDKVKNAKGKVARLGKCKEGMSRYELLIRKQAWLELAVSRAQRDQVCWDGGDYGHQMAQANAWKNVGRCVELLQK